MIEQILEYMADREICASSLKEQERLEAGIAMYLLESGIGDDDTGEYYKNYVNRHLQTISNSDLKAYFMNYALISEVDQIAIEFKCDGAIPEDRKRRLYSLMEELHSCGLGEKYVPIAEIKRILGRVSQIRKGL